MLINLALRGHIMPYFRLILIALLLSACQSLSKNEQVIALETELQAYSTEAIDIRNAMQSNRTEVAATIAVASTQAAEFEHYNDILKATVFVAHPPIEPTRVVVQDTEGPLPLEMYDRSSGEMMFVEVGTAAQIDSNNCFVRHEAFFGMDISTIYMTAMALNLQGGTVVRVDWQYGGDIVLSNSWVAPQAADGQCVALALRASDGEFAAGNWTATMYVNGEALDPISFSIIDNMGG